MPMPGLHRYLDHRKQKADGGQKSLGSLPVLLMLFHTPLEVGNPTAIAIAHQTAHLRFEHAQIAEHLRFEFIHHPHPPDPILSASARPCSIKIPAAS
jgi:hypothetical protein